MRSEGTSQSGLSSWHLMVFAGSAVKIESKTECTCSMGLKASGSVADQMAYW